jgi:Clostridial hydrophobic W
MSEAVEALAPVAGDANRVEPVENRVTELKVSGHLMTLEAGVFCVFQPPGSPAPGRNGLPGVRISLPPGPLRRPDAVTIRTFREDGWLNAHDGAALIRVTAGPAQVLVTVYQSPGAPREAAPRLQVLRLGPEASTMPGPAEGVTNLTQGTSPDTEVVAHIQRTGDVVGTIGDWIGIRGSRLWIEGFAINPRSVVAADKIEYQAVLGRGWLSPWISGGRFCGSRGMALPLLGLRIRLTGEAEQTHEAVVSATFVDGSMAGPVPGGEGCESEKLAALESFQVIISPKEVTKKGQSGEPVAVLRRTTKPAARRVR